MIIFLSLAVLPTKKAPTKTLLPLPLALPSSHQEEEVVGMATDTHSQITDPTCLKWEEREGRGPPPRRRRRPARRPPPPPSSRTRGRRSRGGGGGRTSLPPRSGRGLTRTPSGASITDRAAPAEETTRLSGRRRKVVEEAEVKERCSRVVSGAEAQCWAQSTQVCSTRQKVGGGQVQSSS